MLVRYWQAALIAAITTLLGNVVWAQQTRPQGGFATGFAPPICPAKANCCEVKFSCTTGDCCTDGRCCTNGECCCKNGKCDKKCTCCKDNQCECGKGNDCCCAKSGKCCCQGKTSKTKTAGCPFMDTLAKRVAIIMVMPTPMPMLGSPHIEAMMLPHPPLPVPAHVVLPAPLPPAPMLTPPGIPVPTLTSPSMPLQKFAISFEPPPPQICHPCPVLTPEYPPVLSKANMGYETCLQLLDLASDFCALAHTPNLSTCCASALGLLMDMCPATYAQPSPQYVVHPPQYIPPSPPFPLPPEPKAQEAALTSPPMCGYGLCGTYCTSIATPCSVTTPTPATKIQIVVSPFSDELEMNVSGACVRCKRMAVKIGENEIVVNRCDDRVRVRCDDLKATAASVRIDGKDCMILEGDVVLRYKRINAHSSYVTGERIGLNLTNGTMAVQGIRTITTTPAVHIEP